MFSFSLFNQPRARPNRNNKRTLLESRPCIRIPQSIESKTVSLWSQPYLDTIQQTYKNIVVVNLQPQGPLGEITRLHQFPPLSQYSYPRTKQCGYVLQSLCHAGQLMDVNEIPNLISYLVSNGYSLDTSITKMFNTSDIRFDTDTGNKLICFITYLG
jgi:hypothetical protein